MNGKKIELTHKNKRQKKYPVELSTILFLIALIVMYLNLNINNFQTEMRDLNLIVPD